jgi:preprotein translocase subunit SecG
MQEVILVIHLILALSIIVMVLIQRSSGGGLGIGGSSGGLGDFATARGAANALTKATTICAFCFFGTSLLLAYMGKGTANSGLLSNIDAPAVSAPAMPGSPADTITEPATPPAAKTPEPPISKK